MMRSAQLLAAAGLLLAATPAPGQQFWAAASDGLLAGMRGGFATPSGLVVSFGITRTLMVDGQVVAHSALRVDDLRGLDPQQARAELQGAAPVVQVGSGNVAAGAGGLLPVLVLQNSEDHRRLQSTTVIDVTANSLGMLQQLRFQDALAHAARLGR